MKKFDLNTMSVKQLDSMELRDNSGGWVFAFVAGAIVGGMIYDVYKAACINMINLQIEHPEYYNGAVSSRR